MATEEDNFDIDIYGDGGEDYQQDGSVDDTVKAEVTNEPAQSKDSDPIPDTLSTQPTLSGTQISPPVKLENGSLEDVAQKITSTDDSSHNAVHLPKKAPQTQGLKRQDGSDDRPIDPSATNALFISDLHWWVTDDDIRGWANQSQCEDELDDITFSEHKVNGKSKGQAYVLLKSPQAATAAKQKIESFGDGQQYTKKFAVSYANPFTNPFRTLPKDGPMRNSNNSRSSSGGYGNSSGTGSLPSHGGFNHSGSGGYRGNRGGGYNNRGGGYNRGGYQQPASAGFQSGFQNAPMGGMQPYGGFQSRGGMMGGMRGGPMGMRGGRGGMGANGMMAMPMGNMGMPNLGAQMGAMGMGMPQMGMQGMPGLSVNPSSYSLGQYAPQASHLGGSSYAGNIAGGSPVYGRSISPDQGAIGLPYGSTLPPRPHTTFLQYPVTAASSLFTPLGALPSGHPIPHSPSPPEQSGMLKRGPSYSGQSAFQGNQAQYNPAFFQQGQGSDASWNPHGAKRTRQE